jgi:TolB protein
MRFFLLALCLTVLGFAENPQEIRVQLATQSTLEPIYIGKFQAHACSFPYEHVARLDAVLCYDLNYNGSTKVCPRDEEKETQLLAPQSKAFQPAMWKGYGIGYVLRIQLEDRALHATLFNAQNGALKTFRDIALTGDLAQDRRQIHKLADAIYKALFNQEGIAHSRILFAKGDGSKWSSEIYECDWDGANVKQVTKEGSYCVTPVLLPPSGKYESDTFLYVSYKKGQPKIYLSSIREGIGKPLVDLRGNQFLGSVSKQRDKIAFICDAAGRTDLFVQTLYPESGSAGKPVQLYSYPRSTQASPTFSPDGSKLVFVSDKDSGTRLYVIPTTPSAKRHNAVMLSKKNRENSCPAWSPDGTKLAYSAKTSGIRQIWIYDFGRGEEWQLTSGAGNKENPAWASDSKHIVFNSTDDQTSELYIVNLNQPEALKISQGPGKKHYPTWGSRQ